MTRKFPRNPLEMIFQELEDIDRRVEAYANRHNVTLPFRDKNQLPPGVEGQLVLADFIPPVVVALGDMIFRGFRMTDDSQSQIYTFSAGDSDVTLANPDDSPLVYEYDYPLWETSARTSIIAKTNSIYSITDADYTETNVFHFWRLEAGTKIELWSRNRSFYNGVRNTPEHLYYGMTSTGLKVAWSRPYETVIISPPSESPPLSILPDPQEQDHNAIYYHDFSANTDNEVLRMSDIEPLAGPSYKYSNFTGLIFSPSGDKIVFFTNNFPYTYPNSGILSTEKCYICDFPSGSSISELMSMPYTGTTGSTVYTIGDLATQYVQFNPANPSEIYYVAITSTDGSTSGFAKINDDGTGQTIIYDEGDGIEDLPKISPLGNFIGFFGGHSGAFTPKIINIDGTGVTSYPFDITFPDVPRYVAWSPDESKFCAMGNNTLWILDIATSTWTHSFHSDESVTGFYENPQWVYETGDYF